MPTPAQRRLKRFAVALALGVGAAFLLHALLLWWIDHTIRKRIQDTAHDSGAEWFEPERTTIIADPFAGDLHVHHVKWVSEGPSRAGAPRISGTLDSLVIRGLSYHHLLFGGGVQLNELLIHAADLDIALQAVADRGAKRSSIRDLRCTTMRILLQRSSVQLADSTRITTRTLTSTASSFQYGDTLFSADRLDAEIIGVQVAPFADSTLQVDRITVGEGGTRLAIEGVRFGTHDVRRGAVNLPLERDVISGAVERIIVSGIDPGACRRGVPRARSIRILTGQVAVARDKYRPDPPFKHKPLPARMLRAMPLASGVDSVVVEGLDVSYHEQVDPQRGFAHIPFAKITAVLTEVRHGPTDTLRLDASALVFDRTPVRLHLLAAVGDSSDRNVVDAAVGDLRFARLNDVLAPLTGVALPEGRMDTLILRMTGGDTHASAKCWMRYEGLRVDRRNGKSKVLDPVLNGILNAVVKRARTGDKAGDGWTSYSWQRRRDRSLFNYLWSGVREGAKHSMLPQVVVDQVTKR
ncbi:MAG: hypothetical protein ACO1NQ_12510 [Flavobacteriales bacterium]